MERDLLSVNEDYIYARIAEALSDGLLAIELFKRGFSRNSAGKAFSAVKALLSALVIKYNDKLVEIAKDEEERKWIMSKAHIVTTHSMKTLSMYLEKIGISVDTAVNLALDLHEYQYNGFEPDFSPYGKKDEVKNDMIKVINQIIQIIRQNFEIKDEEILRLKEKLKDGLEKFSKMN
ncbi:PaREP1 family protein [Sulfolobus tengchongensis]|uniref:PaREP1 family protein n=1 Tax=Sulfolobus tengchongensis TaxID=207809 RepID=A0AAX4KYS8_9CREN